MQKSVSLFVILLVGLCHAQGLNENGKIKITVGLTAGCADTVNFISNQVSAAYNQFFNYLEFEFVPWGRTVRSTTDPRDLTCQFQANDCWANNVFRCALDQLADSNAAAVYYMICEFTARQAFLSGSYGCAESMGVNLAELDRCVASDVGHQLSLEAEAKSVEPMGTINFVPSIVINDEVDINTHWAAFINLPGTVCNILLANGVNVQC